MTVTGQDIAATLRAAADHIARYGWNTGDFSNGDCRDGAGVPCCAAGAINVVRTGLPAEGNDRLAEAAKDVLLRHVWDEYEDYEAEDIPVDVDDRIGTWNDHEAASGFEVTATLRAVADRLDPPAVAS